MSDNNEDQVVQEGDYAKLYKEQREENERLNALLTAARLGTAAAVARGQNSKAPVLADTVRAQVGAAQFHQMSRTDKLTSVGLEPELSDEMFLDIFAIGAEPQLGLDLSKSNPKRYNMLREGAKILGLYCKKRK